VWKLERIFSKFGMMITDRRSHLQAIRHRQQQCLFFWEKVGIVNVGQKQVE
jgi:hypothetical protein